MTEVYPEFFSDRCPVDRIVSPHLRRILFELLEADVEVIDLLPSFLEERDRSSEPLYQPADPHWAPRAQTIAALAIADRLKRYEFVRKAQAGPSAFEMTSAPFPSASNGAAFQALTPDQRRRAEESQRRSYLIPKDPARTYDESSPVVFIGDSYNFGLMELVASELNLPVKTLAGGGHTTHAFKDFPRNPDLLEGCKVVVWLVCDSSLLNPWPLPSKTPEAGESTHPTETARLANPRINQ